MVARVLYVLQLVSHAIYQLCPPPGTSLEQALGLVRLKRLNNPRAATSIHTVAPSSVVCVASLLLVEIQVELGECFRCWELWQMLGTVAEVRFD